MVSRLADETADSPLIDLLFDLLRHAPALTLLITSRERLNLQAEDLHTLRGLPTPNTNELATARQFAAVRLFADRAYRLQKSFKLTPENLAHVIHICELVEGLPLSIELAATWIRDLDCAGIAQALEISLDLLQTTSRDVAPQHRSLYAAFDHSWQLLTSQEQDVLCHLAVFQGGFSAAAAVDVVGATLLILSRLRHKSLIRDAGNGRYDMHSLLRRFTLEKLEENQAQAQAVHRRYSQYYLNFVIQRSVSFQGETPQSALTEIRQELGNVRQAWQWSIDNEHLSPLSERDCVAGLTQFYLSSGLSAEGESTFEYALRHLKPVAEDDPNTPQLRQHLLAALAEVLIAQSKYSRAITQAEAALELAASRQDVEGQVWGQQLLGSIYTAAGNPVAASHHLEAALTLARQARQTAREGEILRLLGNSALFLGNRVQAERHMEQALQIHQATNNRMQEQADSLALAMVLMERYDYVAALSHLHNALRLIRATGNQLLEARIENILGFGLAALGQYEAALAHHHISRQIASQIGHPFQESHALHNLCTVSRKLGRLETAERFGREALRLGVENNLLDPQACAWLHLGYLFLDSDQLGAAADAFKRSRLDWLALKHPETVMEATAGEAEAALRQGNQAEALTMVETILSFMAENTLEGADEPFQIYLSLYRVLQANADSRASALLTEARQLIEARASLLPDEETRHTFLFNVPAHQAIMALVDANGL